MKNWMSLVGDLKLLIILPRLLVSITCLRLILNKCSIRCNRRASTIIRSCRQVSIIFYLCLTYYLENLRTAALKDKEQEAEENHNGDLEREDNPDEEIKDVEGEEDAKDKDEQDLNDEIDSLYYGSYTESRRSEVSRRSQLTSATYISKLEKELQEERKAREKLAHELEEIKKISSEISSHLGLKQALENNN